MSIKTEAFAAMQTGRTHVVHWDVKTKVWAFRMSDGAMGTVARTFETGTTDYQAHENDAAMEIYINER